MMARYRCPGTGIPTIEIFFKARANSNIGSSQLPTKADGDRLLQSLNLEASTEPKLAYAKLQDIPNLLTASITPVLRAASGVFAQDYKLDLIAPDATKYSYLPPIQGRQLLESGVYKPPKEPIILYELESCPFCRKVREACSMLSLSVTMKPTPKNGRIFRQELQNKLGTTNKKITFPYLIDPNTGVNMFESSDIISYLFKMYGNGSVPWTLADTQQSSDAVLSTVTAGLGVGLTRINAGGNYETSQPPSLPLQLWAYEGSPFCKIVRERLSSLEISHTVVFTPRGSMNRQLLWERTGGRFQVPFLVDPNTGVELFESQAMCEYLQRMYAVADSPVEFL
ncbi:hypothetical protein MPSEU_001057900 [Mayamaea pseudoterrestris]|nr:hypothetical protein MPSEU_001057900 [Mayamaea pseudoterrestris]